MAAAPSLSRRLALVADRLAGAYGRPRRRLSDPLGTLIETVLSQNTGDLNSGRAYRALRSALPTWAEAGAAKPRTIERAIRVGGLARTKSLRIAAVLRSVREREGRY